jgi:hypothetical protein
MRLHDERIMKDGAGGIENFKWAERAVLVSATHDPTVLLAFGVHISDGVISWFDLIRQRNMTIGKIVRDDAAAFVFERAEPEIGSLGTYQLQPLTLELFRTEVKPHMTVEREFSSEREMADFFMREAGYLQDSRLVQP